MRNAYLKSLLEMFVRKASTVSPHSIFFSSIGNTNKGYRIPFVSGLVIASRRKNIDKTIL